MRRLLKDRFVFAGNHQRIKDGVRGGLREALSASRLLKQSNNQRSGRGSVLQSYGLGKSLIRLTATM